MSTMRRVLVVDDDEDFLVGMRMQLRGRYGVLTARSISGSLELLEKNDVDLVLLDVGLGEENGLKGISKIKKVHPTVGVAMLSGCRNVQTVVEAIRAGAVDYLTKPLDNDTLTAVMERAVATRSVEERFEAILSTQSSPQNSHINMVYRSDEMKALMEQAAQLEGHNANVLIMGETGTGKELLARCLHERAGNRTRPFVAVNCAAIPEHLLESELFGHEAGAFTGATRRRIGKLELANKGDFFLDEISAMKLDVQVKLLRVLQEKEFCRLGSNTPIKVDFRVISASNKPLEKMMESGEFRMDLFHRLRVVQLTLPPLRERRDDIPLLVHHFLQKFSSTCRGITNGALKMLTEYDWPGNVRELANVVESLAILAKGETIDEKAFPSWVMKSHVHDETEHGKLLPDVTTAASNLEQYVRKAERRYIEHVIKQNDGDKTRTAAALGIGRTTLYMKMKELGMQK